MLPRSFGIVNRALPCHSRIVHPTLLLARSVTSTTHPAPAGSITAQNVQQTPQSTTSPTQRQPKGAKAAAKATGAPLDMEEQLAQLDRLHAVEHSLSFDVWAHPLPLFDLRIPSTRKDASIVDRVRGMWAAQGNALRNAIALYRMADANSFPGVSVKSPLSTQVFKTQTTPWLKPFLREALLTYEQINEALASHNQKALRRLTTQDFQEHVLERLRKQNSSHHYVWKLHGENEPSKVVSIRAAEINLSRTPPKIGNRLAVQACVKFDTNQSLQVYNQKGQLLAGDGKPKRVVEYLVFQKRMWYDSPWVVRDQLFEGLEGKFSNSA